MRVVTVYFFAAVFTFELVESGIYPSETDFGFKTPVLAQNPGVSVCEAYTSVPTLVAVVLEHAQAIAQKAGQVDVPEVILTTQEVSAKEVAGKCVAEPVACLGLHHPMAPLLAIREAPGIEVAREVECPFGSELYFCAKVNGGSGVVKQIGFDVESLSVETGGAAYCHDTSYHNAFDSA